VAVEGCPQAQPVGLRVGGRQAVSKAVHWIWQMGQANQTLAACCAGACCAWCLDHPAQHLTSAHINRAICASEMHGYGMTLRHSHKDNAYLVRSVVRKQEPASNVICLHLQTASPEQSESRQASWECKTLWHAAAGWGMPHAPCTHVPLQLMMAASLICRRDGRHFKGRHGQHML
jgi:hypothetical protein